MSPLERGTNFADLYSIESNISSGGTADIYLATERARDHLVVLKVAKSEDSSPNKEGVLLRREADLLRDFRHPSVVQILPIDLRGQMTYIDRAINLEKRPYYIVLEYLAGGTIKDNIDTILSFDLNWRFELFYQVLLAVNFLHLQGYGHRDIKPQNFVFRTGIQKNLTPQPICIDFGICEHQREARMDLIKHAQSLPYAPIERVAQTRLPPERQTHAFDPMQEDIWSLGTLLYYILTGQLPYQSRNIEEFTTNVLNGGPKDIRTLNGELRNQDRLFELVVRMLAKDPGSRPPIDKIIRAIDLVIAPPPRVRVTVGRGKKFF